MKMHLILTTLTAVLLAAPAASRAQDSCLEVPAKLSRDRLAGAVTCIESLRDQPDPPARTALGRWIHAADAFGQVVIPADVVARLAEVDLDDFVRVMARRAARSQAARPVREGQGLPREVLAMSPRTVADAWLAQGRLMMESLEATLRVSADTAFGYKGDGASAAIRTGPLVDLLVGRLQKSLAVVRAAGPAGGDKVWGESGTAARFLARVRQLLDLLPDGLTTSDPTRLRAELCLLTAMHLTQTANDQAPDKGGGAGARNPLFLRANAVWSTCRQEATALRDPRLEALARYGRGLNVFANADLSGGPGASATLESDLNRAFDELDEVKARLTNEPVAESADEVAFGLAVTAAEVALVKGPTDESLGLHLRRLADWPTYGNARHLDALTGLVVQALEHDRSAAGGLAMVSQGITRKLRQRLAGHAVPLEPQRLFALVDALQAMTEKLFPPLEQTTLAEFMRRSGEIEEVRVLVRGLKKGGTGKRGVPVAAPNLAPAAPAGLEERLTSTSAWIRKLGAGSRDPAARFAFARSVVHPIVVEQVWDAMGRDPFAEDEVGEGVPAGIAAGTGEVVAAWAALVGDDLPELRYWTEAWAGRQLGQAVQGEAGAPPRNLEIALDDETLGRLLSRPGDRLRLAPVLPCAGACEQRLQAVNLGLAGIERLVGTTLTRVGADLDPDNSYRLEVVDQAGRPRGASATPAVVVLSTAGVVRYAVDAGAGGTPALRPLEAGGDPVDIDPLRYWWRSPTDV